MPQLNNACRRGAWRTLAPTAASCNAHSSRRLLCLVANPCRAAQSRSCSTPTPAVPADNSCAPSKPPVPAAKSILTLRKQLGQTGCSRCVQSSAALAYTLILPSCQHRVCGTCGKDMHTVRLANVSCQQLRPPPQALWAPPTHHPCMTVPIEWQIQCRSPTLTLAPPLRRIPSPT